MNHTRFMAKADLNNTRRLIADQHRGAGLVVRLGLYALIWWMLSGGDPASWAWGVPVVVAAAVFNPWLPSAASWRWRIKGLLRFIPIFLWYSLQSGVDVAWCAVHPRRLLQPALVDYRWRLPPGPARIFLANTINLVPGTLSVWIQEQTLTIHILHADAAVVEQVWILERRIAELFGLSEVLGDD